MHSTQLKSEQVALAKGFPFFKAWVIALIAGLFFFYEFIQLNMFNALSHSLEQAFTLTAWQYGLVSAFYFLSDSILLYPIGVLLDRISSRKLLIVGMIMCIFSTLLVSWATGAWFLVAARLVAGTASAFCLLSILRMCAQWFPPQKMGQVAGVVVTLGMLGGAVSQTPLTALIAAVHWREALQFVAMLGMGMLVVIVFVVKDAPKQIRYSHFQGDGEHPTIGVWRSLVILARNANNWYVGLYIALMNLPVFVIGGLFGTQFMVQGHHLSVMHASTVSMMIFMGTIVGSPVFGFLSDRIASRRRPMVVASILSFITLAVILFMPSVNYLSGLILLFMLGVFTSAQIIGYPVTRELNHHTMVGSALGFVSVIIMGLPGIVQPAVGYLLDLGWKGQWLNGVHNYSLWDYDISLLPLLIGMGVSVLCACLLPESYGEVVEEL